MSICIVVVRKCFIGGAVLKMKMMKLAVITISLFLIGLAIHPTEQVKAQEGAAGQALGIVKSIISGFYSLITQIVPFISVFINTGGALIAGLFATSPEFFSGFIPGFVAMVLMGYLLLAWLPTPFFALLITFFTGFPAMIVDIPLFYISLLWGLPVGVVVGFILGILNLANIPTPAEQANIPIEALATGTVRREGGEWVIYPPTED